MDTITTLNVSELSPSNREAVESLLGRSLEADSKVCILTFAPDNESSQESRKIARERLASLYAKADQHAQQQPQNDEQVAEMIDDAVKQLRSRKK